MHSVYGKTTVFSPRLANRQPLGDLKSELISGEGLSQGSGPVLGNWARKCASFATSSPVKSSVFHANKAPAARANDEFPYRSRVRALMC